MAEWLYEEGIGENRAILVEDGNILEAEIEWPGELRVGAIVSGRLAAIPIPGRRGIVATGAGDEILVEPLPPSLSQGRAVRVEIVREPIPEPGRPKMAKGRIAEAPEREGPSLAERIAPFTRIRAHDPDRFEEAGWSELLEEALSGEIAFPGGALRMSLTPAMTLFDVDGGLPPDALAVAGAEAAARAIRRFGIGGSIGIDLPTLPGRAERHRAAAAFDAILPQPFERTAVNGFGFLQIVRPRRRASLAEHLQADPAGAAARFSGECFGHRKCMW
ncbi:MAG TPA: ribonuclease [Allosphingosinicella sp.]|nr:ribonuclease [Allosphingosinicella sp.]